MSSAGGQPPRGPGAGGRGQLLRQRLLALKAEKEAAAEKARAALEATKLEATREQPKAEDRGHLSPATPSRASSPSQPESPPAPPVWYRGQEGVPINLTANYLKLTPVDGASIHEHEVRFSPAVDNVDARRRLVYSLGEELIGRTKSYDGNKLFLPKAVTANSITLEHPHTGDDVRVSILPKRRLAMGDQTLSQHYNILFNKINRTLKMAEHQRKYYDSAQAHKIPVGNRALLLISQPVSRKCFRPTSWRCGRAS